MLDVDCVYIAAGGNRHPSAADWTPDLLAFGAGNNIALWNPKNVTKKGIHALITGHTDVVNAIRIYDTSDQRWMISGGADNTLRIWTQRDSQFEQTQCLAEHQGSINTISLLPNLQLFVTGAADGTVKAWKFVGAEAKLHSSITLKPRYIPLTTAIVELEDGTIVLAVAGTSTSVQLYSSHGGDGTFELQTTLSGHEGWIRSLDFVKPNSHSSDVLLASASQDKYIRLWRICKPSAASQNGTLFPQQKTSLSNKIHQVRSGSGMYNVLFEALLIGHEDWIYTVRWGPKSNGSSTVRLLSASADNSLAIWEPDPSSGVWICQTRLGEISSQKGSTTATGSTGGFWIGLWDASGDEVVSLGRTGSWRRWRYDRGNDIWKQIVGISGHTQEVQDVAWAYDGSYVISTGSDQTTRLIAEWKRAAESSWHEFARPQIHGYDLNCIDSLNANQFVSGADEKLLRVFNKPRDLDTLLSKLCGAASGSDSLLSDAANIPVLGLSNKAIAIASDDERATNGMPLDATVEMTNQSSGSAAHGTLLDLDHPPFEEHLARSTLWPEHEKLYGHGYEISAVAASHDGSVIATACKASSIEHAMIRLYETKEWREIKPPLSAHNLTVTALAFSHNDHFLLSVGRDRQWTLFKRNVEDPEKFQLAASNAKAHSRMILDCAWASDTASHHVFATAGRDKSIKIWRQTAVEDFECVRTISLNAAATAVAFDSTLLQSCLRVAYGGEDGAVHVALLHFESLEIASSYMLPASLLPSGAINALRWRPQTLSEPTNRNLLAVVSDDASLRILNVGP